MATAIHTHQHHDMVAGVGGGLRRSPPSSPMKSTGAQPPSPRGMRTDPRRPKSRSHPKGPTTAASSLTRLRVSGAILGLLASLSIGDGTKWKFTKDPHMVSKNTGHIAVRKRSGGAQLGWLADRLERGLNGRTLDSPSYPCITSYKTGTSCFEFSSETTGS
ncbi:hypothetical protein B0T21DRAFT_397287 [Apiosordaria backusii]|uniref:Uncharacterized protein n=1 Tax=Apiosordaria backusii TaxID=314023 RepID=A0AA39ZSR0_9PEZI|nr:hypothetical protein B0T21DRAFT_397287 [Apiosordaria backusii]